MKTLVGLIQRSFSTTCEIFLILILIYVVQGSLSTFENEYEEEAKIMYLLFPSAIVLGTSTSSRIEYARKTRENRQGLEYSAVLLPCVMAARMVYVKSRDRSDYFERGSFWAAISISTISSLSYAIETRDRPKRFMKQISMSICIAYLCVINIMREFLSDYNRRFDPKYVLVTISILFTLLHVQSLRTKLLYKTTTLGETFILFQGFSMWISSYIFGFNSNDPVCCIMRSGTLACFSIVLIATFVFSSSNNTRRPTLMYATVFFTSLALIFAFPLMWFALGQNPVTWLFVSFIMGTPTRVCIIFSWGLVLLLALPNLQSGSKNIPRIVSRKLFHILAVVMFLPVLYFDLDMLYVSFGIASSLMILAECSRVLRVSRIYQVLSRYMLSFTDDRDQGTIVMSHFYLLLGCAIPLWLVPRSAVDNSVTSSILPASAGILSVGIGDAVAAVIGTFMGRTKWYGTNKTVEGTLIASVVTSALAVSLLLVSEDKVTKVLTFVTMTCLLETFTKQMDNLILPLYLFSLLALI